MVRKTFDGKMTRDNNLTIIIVTQFSDNDEQQRLHYEGDKQTIGYLIG
jgi:hypothetical protein